jgi:glycosyltransferase involved in cell wall biosynthesis
LRIGVLPYLDPRGGGTYQHCLNVVEALRVVRAESADDEYVLLVRDLAEARRAGVHRSGLPVRPLSWRGEIRNRLRRVARALGLGRLRRALVPAPAVGPDPDAVAVKPRVAAGLRRLGIELMVYPTLDPLAFEVDVPSVATVHDIQVVLQPGLPEFAGEVGAWEYLLRNTARKALLVVVDSEVGREDVLGVYGRFGLTAERVRILPYLPAPYLASVDPVAAAAAVRRRYPLPARFVFYPAQFWPHKNHRRLVEAIALLRSRAGLDVPLVLCGGHGGELRERTFAEVNARAAQLDVAGLVRSLGFVPDADMAGLYAAAEALVFPTFFGPTNIPVVEAWALGCPVVTSDIRGVREQAGDAALLADPASVESIAGCIRRVWTEPGLRAELTARGRARVAGYGADKFRRRLTGIIEEAKATVRGRR